jgi:ABC-type protease/lipase transport system fused ATPase/permease subunit
METLAKSIATVLMWAGFLIMLLFAMNPLGGLTVVLALVLMIPLLAIMAFMWVVNSPAATNASRSQGENRRETSQEKRKRDVLDAVLRDLSDEQLANLRERLREPGFEDRLDYMLGDDGELVQRG